MNKWHSKPKNLTLLLFFLIIFHIIARVIALPSIDIYDDAFITFRYAENFADTKGFVYNEGEYYLGVTGPAFGLLASFIDSAGLDLPMSIRILNILLEAAALFILSLLLIKQNYNYSVLVLVFLLSAISPINARITLGAMEMNLFAFTSVFAIYFVIQYNLQILLCNNEN